MARKPPYGVLLLVFAVVASMSLATEAQQLAPESLLDKPLAPRKADRSIVLTDVDGDGRITAAELQKQIDQYAGMGLTTLLLPGSFDYRLEQTVFVPRGVSLVGQSADNPPVLKPHNGTINLREWAELAGIILSNSNLPEVDPAMLIEGRLEANPERLEDMVQRIHSALDADPRLAQLERTGRHLWVPGNIGEPYRLLESRFDLLNFAMSCRSPATGLQQRCLPKDISDLEIDSVTLAYARLRDDPDYEWLDRGAGSPILQLSDNLEPGEPWLPGTADYGDLAKLTGAPVTELKDVKIRCASGPQYPVRGRALEDLEAWGSGAGFWAMGVAIQAANHVRVSGVDIDGCAIGIYSYGTAYLVLENNTVRTGLPEDFLDQAGTGTGDFAVRPSLRYQGQNGIRLHGPSDHDQLVRWNEVGERSGARRRPTRAIHLHGSVVAARVNGNGMLAELPGPTLEEQADWANHFEGTGPQLRIGRRNFWIYGNTVHGALEAGVDIRADQANVVIAANRINNVGSSPRFTKSSAGIKLQRELHASSFRGIMFYPRNVLIEGNTIADSSVGIQVSGSYDGAGTYTDFQRREPGAAVSNCADNPAGCASAVRIHRNNIRRTEGTGIFITAAAGVHVTNNELEDVYRAPRPGSGANNRNVILQADSVQVEYGLNLVRSTDTRRSHDKRAIDLWPSYTSLLIRANKGGSLYLAEPRLAKWLVAQSQFRSKGGSTVLLGIRELPAPSELSVRLSAEMLFQPFW